MLKAKIGTKVPETWARSKSLFEVKCESALIKNHQNIEAAQEGISIIEAIPIVQQKFDYQLDIGGVVVSRAIALKVFTGKIDYILNEQAQIEWEKMVKIECLFYECLYVFMEPYGSCDLCIFHECTPIQPLPRVQIKPT